MTAIHPQIVNSLILAKKYLAKTCDPVGSSIFEHGQRVYARLNAIFLEQGIITQKELNILSAALLHDLLEDSDCPDTIIVKAVNKNVLQLVKELTISFENKSLNQAVISLNYISSDAYLIKLVDMIDNTQKSHFFVSTNTPNWYYEFYFPLLRLYSKFNLSHLKKMRIENYQYLDQAIKLHDEFNRLHKSLKRLVQTLDSIDAVQLDRLV